jgi:CRISPR/Cas system endoribonuclease Cas6 (RAMP superfamily)
MIACFYFWYHFISEALPWSFNSGDRTCVSLHCRSLSKSLRHVFPFLYLVSNVSGQDDKLPAEATTCFAESFKTPLKNFLVMVSEAREGDFLAIFPKTGNSTHTL